MKTAIAPKQNNENRSGSPAKPFFAKSEENSFFSDKEHTPPFFPGIQTKLTVGEPGDKYELEADAMADQIVQRLRNGHEPLAERNGESYTIQRKCSACKKEEKLQKKENIGLFQKEVTDKPKLNLDSIATTAPIHLYSTFSHTPSIQQKCSSCDLEDKVQLKEYELLNNNLSKEHEAISIDDPNNSEEDVLQASKVASPNISTPNLEIRLNSSKGGGSSLPNDLLSTMESGFGADFSNVKIHTGSEAVSMNRELGAQAFTHGNDIYFDEGKYDTQSKEGKHLLAHELTHTIQQGSSIQTQLKQKYKPNSKPNIQAAWYNFDIPGTDYQFDPSIQGIKNAANITVEAGEDAVDWVKDKAIAIYNKLKNLINRGKNWITNKWEALKIKASDSLDVVKNIYNTIVHFVKSPLAIISSAIINMDADSIQSSWNSVTSFVLSIWDNFQKMGLGFIDSVEKVWNKISGYADDLFSSISSVTNNWVFKHLPSSLRSTITGLIESVRSLWEDVKKGWNGVFNKLKSFVEEAFESVRSFIQRVLSFAIGSVISAIVQFGKLCVFLLDFFKNPQPYLQSLAAKMMAPLNGVESQFAGQVSKYFSTEPSNKAVAENTTAITVPGIQKKPADRSEKESAEWSEIGDGILDMMGKKWEHVKSDPLSIVTGLLWDMFLPIVGNVRDVIKLFDDIKKIAIKPLSAGSLEEFWTSLLHILDIPILIYNTIWSIIGRSIMLPLLIASFVPHPVVKGIAIAAGYALLGAMITGEVANIGHKMLLLKTAKTNHDEKKDAYNSLSDSLIAFALEIALAILILVVSAIANVIKGIFNFVKSKVFKPKIKPPKSKGKGDTGGGKKEDATDPPKKKKVELPEDLAKVCKIGSINCNKIPDSILDEVAPYPSSAGHNVPFPDGPFKIRKSFLSGATRRTKKLQQEVLTHPDSWNAAFRKALDKANGKKKVDAAIKSKETENLKWPTENGKAWEVHHNKPVSYGGHSKIANLTPLPSTVHRLFTSWWTKIQNKFRSRFTKEEWDSIMRDQKDISGSRAAKKSPI